MNNANRTLRLILGAVMLLIGAWLLVRIHVLGEPAKVGSPLIETVFGVFFILRGAISFRRRQPLTPNRPGGPPSR